MLITDRLGGHTGPSQSRAAEPGPPGAGSAALGSYLESWARVWFTLRNQTVYSPAHLSPLCFSSMAVMLCRSLRGPCGTTPLAFPLQSRHLRAARAGRSGPEAPPHGRSAGSGLAEERSVGRKRGSGRASAWSAASGWGQGACPSPGSSQAQAGMPDPPGCSASGG